jgi:hypothetical protein
MPLDARKTAHMASVVPKSWAGRQKTVTLVSESGGTQSYSAVTVIFRPMAEPDPTVADATGRPPALMWRSCWRRSQWSACLSLCFPIRKARRCC